MDAGKVPMRRAALAIVAILSLTPVASADWTFVRGDFDGDGTLALGDAISLLSMLFLGGNPTSCIDAADVDDNGNLALPDAVLLLDHMFINGMGIRRDRKFWIPRLLINFTKELMGRDTIGIRLQEILHQVPCLSILVISQIEINRLLQDLKGGILISVCQMDRPEPVVPFRRLRKFLYKGVNKGPGRLQ